MHDDDGREQALRRHAKARARIIESGGAGLSITPSTRPGAVWGEPELPPNLFVTMARLTADTLALLSKLPPSIDHVAAIPRSGLIPGSVLAAHLHVPLSIAGRECVQGAGHGIRMDETPQGASHVLLIDDTAAYGREMARREPIVRAAFPGARITRAVVYSTREGRSAVDHVAAIIPGPHYLAWNWQNAGHGQGCAYDFDGILCREAVPAEDDDGPRYLEFLANASPLYLPRRKRIHTIVTARHEKYRAETLAWLERHRVAVDHLVMRDWPIAPDAPWADQVGAWKADHYRRSGQPLMAESCPEQAAIIARIARKPVLCPQAERVFIPPPPGVAEAHAERERLRHAVEACPHLGPVHGEGCACTRHCRAGKGKAGIVMSTGETLTTIDDCGRCPELPTLEQQP